MKSIVAMIVFLLMHAATAYAQSYYFHRYQVENGLSHNTVYSSVQDKQGFLWFGTRDGLNRFDGKNFKVFQHDPEDPLTLKNNFIRCLYEDHNAVLWVGTYKGLYYYNRKHENFIAVKNAASGSIGSIVADDSNNIWFVDNSTLRVYLQKEDTVITYDQKRFFYASALCKAKDNSIWIGTTDGNLKKYNARENNFTSYKIFKSATQAAFCQIETIYATSANKLLIGTTRDGIKLFDMVAGKYSPLFSGRDISAGIPVRSFLEKNSSEYWIGTESGVYVYNTVTGKTIHLQKNYNDPYAISDNAVYTLTLDREGGVWIGTYFGGVNYYPSQHMVFEKFFPDYTLSTISGNAVTEISQDKYDDLWIATEDAGINKLSRKTNVFTHILSGNSADSLSYFNIHCILVTGDTLWAGTWGHGIDLLNIKTGKIITKFKAGPGDGELKNNTILRLCQSSNGDVLVGTDNGLFRYNKNKGVFYQVTEVPQHEAIYAILEDKEGTIWVGSKGQSVYYFNRDSKVRGIVKTSIRNSNGEDVGLNQITGISEDSNGSLWFATEGSGIINFDSRQWKILKRFTTKNGLPSNTVFKIIEDNNKHLWISSSKGLVRLNLMNGSIKIFTKSSGLLNDQFNYNSGFKARDGRIYFGSVKGLIGFNPSHFIPNSHHSPLYITGFQVNNKELVINGKNSPLKESIISSRKLLLKYQENTFSIDFSSLSFMLPEMLEYKYMMTGIDKDWNYMKSNRRVYYTELPAGTYTFKVSVTNYSGTWSNHETTLVIEILPAWWVSKTAFVLYAIISATMVLLIIHFYHKRSMEKNRIKIAAIEHEREKQLYEAKIDFFTNVAHEIRTPLTLIKAPLERVIKKAGKVHAFGNNLKIMEFNTQRLVELTNQFLDFRKTETNSFRVTFMNVNITDLLQERYASFKPIAEDRNIQFTLNMPDMDVYAFVDIDAIHKVLNNLLTNALNYCQQTVAVSLSMLHEQDRFMIEFVNDGYVVPGSMKKIIFEPFYRLQETEQRAGTGIGLALSKSLVEMHKGEIYLKDPVNNMNCIVLVLPIRQYAN